MLRDVTRGGRCVSTRIAAIASAERGVLIIPVQLSLAVFCLHNHLCSSLKIACFILDLDGYQSCTTRQMEDVCEMATVQKANSRRGEDAMT